nr:MAG TPA: hypothetical protein [Caudoviricetes sp.]
MRSSRKIWRKTNPPKRGYSGPYEIFNTKLLMLTPIAFSQNSLGAIKSHLS